MKDFPNLAMVKLINGNEIDRLASNLEDRARDEDDLMAAKWLRSLYVVSDAARDVVMANTHQGSKAAYDQLWDIFRGKKGE
jgi:hypothetical protein